ncbi:MAG: hypothetical protein E6R04_04420 [Spirochaetes bacterium]|nr:MAG: hypothetical protein E6R04_04420 [Spirochaetota bacterium]
MKTVHIQTLSDGVMHNQLFLVCDSCDTRFGGSNDGHYEGNSYGVTYYAAENSLRKEALDMGWIHVIHHDEALLCSVTCARKWLSRKLTS